jgi:hypothetical protein
MSIHPPIIEEKGRKEFIVLPEEELLAIVRTLRGSISLPAKVDDKTLITEARSEKHGPVGYARFIQQYQ